MASRPRPLSPHLQVYRWQAQMVTSILHRATGILLSIGALLIAAALLAMATGPEAWQCVQDCAASWPGRVLLFGWTWAFAYHLVNGIRHLLQDAGYGFGVAAFVRNSWISIIGSVALTVIVWGAVAAQGGLS